MSFRLVPREQTDQALAPRTVVSQGLASDHGEATSRPGRATTAATHHPEAEDGPLGEPTPRRLPVWTDCTCMHHISLKRVVKCDSQEIVLLLHYLKVQCG